MAVEFRRYALFVMSIYKSGSAPKRKVANLVEPAVLLYSYFGFCVSINKFGLVEQICTEFTQDRQ